MPYKHYHQAIQAALAQADAAQPDPAEFADRKCAVCGDQADYRLTSGGGGMMRTPNISDACSSHRNTGEHAGMSVFQSYTRPMNQVPQRGPRRRATVDPTKYTWER